MFRGKFLFYLGVWGIAIPVQAYTLITTQSGHPIRWHYGQKFFLAGNPTNQSGISSSSLWNAVVNGLQQWNHATERMFTFDYWQGTNPRIYETKQQQDGLNSIFFASQSNQKTDPNVIGFTQVWFNSTSGDLMEADIILNDRDYILTETSTDTSSHDDGHKHVYLNNVVTHELGHALGLSHSNSINSTMLYVEFSEQFKLGCDDWSAVKDLYPTSKNGMGSLTGVILSPTQEPVAGAVVTAISLARGIPMASVLTDQNGKFHFGALESGDFSIMVESYQGNPASIPAKMRAKTDLSICENNRLPKNFITEENDHQLKKFKVSVGKNSVAGALTLHCGEVSETPITDILQASDAVVDRGDAGTTKQYTFNADGDFKITGLSYLLLSPVKLSLSLFDAAGNPLVEQTSRSLYRSKKSSYRIDDAVVSGRAFGPITVKVEIGNHDTTVFPTPSVQPSSSPYFVLIFNGNPEAKFSSSIPNNARCALEDSFEDYQSPPGNPVRNSATSFTRDHIGFCGNAEAASFRPGKSAPQKHFPTFGALLGWAFPFLVAIVCQLFLKRHRAKLGS